MENLKFHLHPALAKIFQPAIGPSIIRNVVTFQSFAFNCSERKDYFLNHCGYGEDAALWLMDQLGQTGIQTGFQPLQKDGGWYFGLRSSEGSYHFSIRYRCSEKTETGIWIGCLENKPASPHSLFKTGPAGDPPRALAMIHRVLSESPQIRHLEWHFKGDIEANAPENQAD